YGTGLGSCGKTDTDTDYICAVSKILYDSFNDMGNPNNNPVCGKKIRAHYNGNSVVVTVHDRCEACAVHDLDFSPAAFQQLGSKDEGRLHGMQV
ncbi:RlpA-like double-psi beta-barrel-protein domain-containing protein-containing protein, partial [Phakopsora pachyrhizi]